MKYFLLGAFSSAFFLFGVAMGVRRHWYDTASRPTSSNALAGQTGNQALALLAFVFLVIGFGFKVSAAPFHMWTPDVYQGAPTPVIAFMAAATKVAAFFALIRVLDVGVPAAHVGLDAGRSASWRPRRSSSGSVLAIAQSRHQADAGVLEHRARRVHPDRADRRRTASGSARRCSTWSRTR